MCLLCCIILLCKLNLAGSDHSLCRSTGTRNRLLPDYGWHFGTQFTTLGITLNVNPVVHQVHGSWNAAYPPASGDDARRSAASWECYANCLGLACDPFNG